MIWRIGQYLPVTFCTLGAAIVSVSTAWDTGLRGSWWLPALGLASLALAVELSKPFLVRERMWFFAGVCVVISGLAEYQMVARARASMASASVVDDKRFQADRAADFRERLAAIEPARSVAELTPLVEAAERTAGDCPKNMGPAQREACRALPQLKSEAARAKERADLTARIEAAKIGGFEVRGAAKTDEAAALAGLTGLSPQLVDQLLALLLIVLFQLASVGAARIVPRDGTPWTTDPASDLSPPENARVSWPSDRATPVPEKEENDVPADQELVRVFLRGKGGTFAGSQRAMASALGWGRNKFDRVTKEMIRQGFVRVTANGIQLVEKEIV